MVLGHEGTLQAQQSGLAVGSARIAGERAVRTHHTVTGHDDADRIASHGAADGACRAATSGLGLDVVGYLPVGAGDPPRDGAQARPHALLEVGAARGERGRFPRVVTGKAPLQPGSGPRENSRLVIVPGPDDDGRRLVVPVKTGPIVTLAVEPGADERPALGQVRPGPRHQGHRAQG